MTFILPAQTQRLCCAWLPDGSVVKSASAACGGSETGWTIHPAWPKYDGTRHVCVGLNALRLGALGLPQTSSIHQSIATIRCREMLSPKGTNKKHRRAIFSLPA